MTKLFSLIALVSLVVGCSATNPALMSDADRSARGIMSHRAEARTNERNTPKVVKSTPAPQSWIDRTYKTASK